MTNKTTKHLPQTILFAHYGDNWIRGSERCLLDLIKHLDKTQFKAVLWCNQPLMAEAAKALDIDVYCSDFPLLFGWQAPRFNVSAFFNLIKEAVKLIKQHNIRLIHANSAAPCQWLTIAAKRSNVPLLCHMHSIYQFRDRLTLGLYQTDMAVGVSKYVIEPLVKDKKPSKQISVIANGIDTQRLLDQEVINARETLGIQIGDFVIASLGSLIHRKGIDTLISAMPKLLEQEVDAHLLIIGEGPEIENLKKQIAVLDLQNKVSLIGEQENAIGILRGTADLFVSAAREEAFGLVFAEASLAGLAIVAPKTGGIPDVVIDGKTGLLVASDKLKNNNIDELVNAIKHLFLSPAKCNEMAKAAQQHVVENFTIERNSEQFQLLYQNLINTHAIKIPWYKKISLTWSLLSTFSTAVLNSYKRVSKRGLTYER